MSKTSVISGVCGQDGSLLAELLLDKGYKVYGLIRPSTKKLVNLQKCFDNRNFIPVSGDLLNLDSINTLVALKPDEFYHLGALTHVGQSFNHPILTLETNTIATARILDALHKHSPSTRLYFAATSEMYPKDDSRLDAHSPYAASKVAAHLLVQQYRQAYGMFAVSGTAYNHESRRRPPSFVTRKLAEGVANYARTGDPVQMGNMSAMRDWHYAGDTVRGMWLALQYKAPVDFTFASGDPRSVKEFAQEVCNYYDVRLEDAVIGEVGEKRPLDVDYLCGDYSVARLLLDWEPSMTFKQLVREVCQPHG